MYLHCFFMLYLVLSSYSVNTENLCFYILEESERILYRWHCCMSVQNKCIHWSLIWKSYDIRCENIGCICQNTFNWVCLMAPLWMKNYSLVEYKVFWISAVDTEWKCYLQTRKSSVIVSCCSDKFFFFFFWIVVKFYWCSCVSLAQ